MLGNVSPDSCRSGVFVMALFPFSVFASVSFLSCFSLDRVVILQSSEHLRHRTGEIEILGLRFKSTLLLIIHSVWSSRNAFITRSRWALNLHVEIELRLPWKKWSTWLQINFRLIDHVGSNQNEDFLDFNGTKLWALGFLAMIGLDKMEYEIQDFAITIHCLVNRNNKTGYFHFLLYLLLNMNGI